MSDARWSDEAILEVLREVLEEVLEKPVAKLEIDGLIAHQFGIDSLALVEIAACLEERFDRRMPPLEELTEGELTSVRDLVKLARRILDHGKPLGLGDEPLALEAP
jgi:acyl carrier protein